MAGNSEVKMLSELAEKYRNTASCNPRENWADLLKAHTLYNSCAVRSPTEKWNRLVYEVQDMYWKEDVSSTVDQQMSMSKDFQKELLTIRNSGRDELSSVMGLMNKWDCNLDNLDSNHNRQITTNFCDALKKISSKTNAQMKVLAGKIIQKSMELCKGELPCKFTAVAMGSLAKGEATPYSDLEFMFLVERKDAEIVSYFEQLAMTVYFLIGNIQETKLKYMNIEELKNFDDKCSNGFKIDGLQWKAGNIPTGNGTPEQKNKFILTTDELIEQYQSIYLKPNHQEAIKGDFTAMLAHTTVLYGDHGLLEEFREAQSKIKANNERKSVHHDMLQQDIMDYDFLPLEELHDNNHSVDLKSAIYRFPSILIYNLKIMYDINSVSSWQTLEILIQRRQLSRSFGESLRFLLASAIYIRLAAYIHHNSQNENMTFVPQSQSNPGEADKSHFWHLPPPLALHMSVHLIPVKKSLAFKNIDQISKAMAADIKYDSRLVAANVQFQACNFVEAKKLFEKVKEKGYITLSKLAHCYLGLQQWNSFQSTVKELLKLLRSGFQHKSPVELYWIFKTATGFLQQGDVANAKIGFDKLMKWLEELEVQPDFDAAAFSKFDMDEMYVHAGRFYTSIDKIKLADDCFAKAALCLQNTKVLLGEAMYEYRKSTYLHTRAASLIDTGRFREAEPLALEGKALLEKMYGVNARQVRIANNYQALGNIYAGLGEDQKASKYHDMSSGILNELDPTSMEYSSKCNNYSNDALMYESKGDFDNALRSYKVALEILERSSNYHPSRIAEINRRIAFILRLKGDLPEAEAVLRKAISMYSKLTSPDIHVHLARCKFDMAKILQDKGCNKEAKQHFHDVTTEYDIPSTKTSHQDVLVECFSSIADMHIMREDYSTSIEYYQKAIDVVPDSTCLSPSFVTQLYHHMCISFLRKREFASAHKWSVKLVKYLQKREQSWGGQLSECYLWAFSTLLLNAKNWGIISGLLRVADPHQWKETTINLYIGPQGDKFYM